MVEGKVELKRVSLRFLNLILVVMFLLPLMFQVGHSTLTLSQAGKSQSSSLQPEIFANPANYTMQLSSEPSPPYPTYNISIMAENMPQVLVLEISVKINDTDDANITGYFKGADFNNLGFSIGLDHWDKPNSDLQYLDAASLSPIDISTPVEIFKIQIQVKQFTTTPILVDIYEQYVGDVNDDTLLSGDCPNDHTIYMNAIQTNQLAIGGTYYNVTTFSNSSISQMSIDTNNKILSFQTGGMDGSTGFVNVTIPKNFLNANATDWVVMVDSNNATYTITSDSTNTYIYIIYSQSIHQIHITGTSIVPEFPSITMLAIFMALTTFMAVLVKKKRLKRLY